MPSLPADFSDGESAAESPFAPDRGAHTPDFHAARILIVDDEQMNIFLLKSLLRQAGYTNLVTTTNSLEVAQLCEESAPPDLVLLDVMMPQRDGFAILEDLAPLREQNGLPVLMLTADTRSETRERALASGASALLTKPLTLTEVLRVVHELLERAQSQRQLRAQQSASPSPIP